MALSTPREIIAALGGIQAVADLTGRGYSAVGNWNRGAQFPANTFVVIQRALARQRLTAPASLWGMADADA